MKDIEEIFSIADMTDEECERTDRELDYLDQTAKEKLIKNISI